MEKYLIELLNDGKEYRKAGNWEQAEISFGKIMGIGWQNKDPKLCEKTTTLRNGHRYCDSYCLINTKAQTIVSVFNMLKRDYTTLESWEKELDQMIYELEELIAGL